MVVVDGRIYSFEEGFRFTETPLVRRQGGNPAQNTHRKFSRFRLQAVPSRMKTGIGGTQVVPVETANGKSYKVILRIFQNCFFLLRLGYFFQLPSYREFSEMSVFFGKIYKVCRILFCASEISSVEIPRG